MWCSWQNETMPVSERESRPPKGEAFSIRLSSSTDRFVEAEARRRKRSKSAIVEALTEEAARTQRFPGIGFMGEDYDRRAWVVGTGMDVWELIELARSYGDDDDAILEDFPRVNRRHLHIARAYARSYPEEVEGEIAENRRPVEEWLELYPFIEHIEVDSSADPSETAPR